MSNWKRPHPPRIGERLLYRILPEPERRALLGDYEELYKDLVQRRGRFMADLWYWMQICRMIPSIIYDSIEWSVIMIRNYLKIALRNLKRHKAYSIINILGLTLGLTCSFLIIIYIKYEFSYDAFHENADQIYRILVNNNHYYRGRNQAAVTPPTFGPAIRERFPEVLNMCRIDNSRGFLKTGERSFYEEDLGFVDPGFLVLFDFPLIHGDATTVLNDPFSLILSQEMAAKYFGNENPVGQTITVNDRDTYTVKGIMRNMPENSYFRFDFLASWSSLERIRGIEHMNSWNQYTYWTFLLLDSHVNLKELEGKIQTLFQEHKPDFITGCELQNLRNIHFHNKALFELGTTSDIRTIYILSSIGLALLLIACFNYINLSTARTSSRIREIGIRKVVGAYRRNLIRQFLGESFGLATIAFVIAVFLVIAILPPFCTYMQRNIPLSFMVKPQHVICLLGLLGIIGLAAGLYPAFLLSSFRPSIILRSTSHTTSRKSNLRNSLVILQFVITTTLIVTTFVTRKQIGYVRNRDLGYEKASILSVPVSRAHEDPQVIRQELQKVHSIQDVTLSSQTPATITNAGLPNWEGKQTNEDIPFFRLYIDENFLDFYRIPVVLGRKFSVQEMIPERTVILNETAAGMTGWTHPIGKKIYDGDDDKEGRTVIGVVKDFHFASLHIPVAPLMIMTNPDHYDVISLKVDPNTITETIQLLNEKWKTYTSIYPFDYTLMEEQLEHMYRSEHRLLQGMQVFAFIAIFIACLGLIGLSSYTVERKTKEIGIRKILGATISGIFMTILRQTMNHVAVGTIIALPLGYLIMNRWLENFAYRIHIGIEVLIFASLTTILVAVLTVSYLSIKAATTNPVEALRYE